MFQDPSLQSLVSALSAKTILVLVAALGWLAWTWPFWKWQNQAFLKAERARRFPLPSLVLVSLLSVGAFAYWQYEGAFRKVEAVSNPLIERREEKLQAIASGETPKLDVREATGESLEEKSARLLEEAARENEQAKRKFDEQNPNP